MATVASKPTNVEEWVSRLEAVVLGTGEETLLQCEQIIGNEIELKVF
jgi:hypothetical protein